MLPQNILLFLSCKMKQQITEMEQNLNFTNNKSLKWSKRRYFRNIIWAFFKAQYTFKQKQADLNDYFLVHSLHDAKKRGDVTLRKVENTHHDRK